MTLKPGEVKTEHIAPGAVTTPKIADEAVVAAKIKDGAVKTEKLATGAVSGSKIGEGQIYGSKLRDGAVRSEKIAAGAITTTKIGELQVTTSRLQDKSVTTEKLSTGAVTTEKIANASVTPAKLSFTPPSIARPITPPITSAELGVGSVESDKIKDGAVTPAKLSFVLGAGFVPRLTDVVDFDEHVLTLDDNTQIDGLDLTGIVPAGTKGVILEVRWSSIASSPYLSIYPDSVVYPLIGMDFLTAVNHFLCPVCSDLKLDYVGNKNSIAPTLHLWITVIGWFI